MSDDKLRLFTAVCVPGAQLRWLHAAVAGAKASVDARWTSVGDQHVTLNFLGWIPGGDLAEVIAALDVVAARHSRADASISGLGAFPRLRRARVLWAGIDDPEELLPALAEDLGRELRAVGYVPEDRGFTPHLTLARLKTPRSLEGALPELPASSDRFAVDRITLFRSRLAPSGARYEILHEAYLRADDATLSQ